MKNFESDSRSHLHAAMTNPAESDSTLEAYRSWIKSKISKLKKFGYKVSERKFRSGFVPLMEIWKLRNTPLCLLAPEIKEVIQEAEVDFDHPKCVMEDVAAQLVPSEKH